MDVLSGVKEHLSPQDKIMTCHDICSAWGLQYQSLSSGEASECPLSIVQ